MIDIHTHYLSNAASIAAVGIENRLLAIGPPLAAKQPFSLGLHPWYINQHPDWQKELTETIEIAAENPMFWAIGECGLDKNTAYSLDLQTSVLNLHCELAILYRKPLIIHCVAAFNELLQWKKSKKIVPPMLVHGFEKKLPLLSDLLKAGFYVSFGAALCKNRPTLEDAFRQMPLDKLFLETDDQNEYGIDAVYMAAATLKNIPLDLLVNKINTNFETVFGKSVMEMSQEK